MNVPGWLLPHRITVEPYEGSTPNGPAFGAPVVDVPAMVSEAVRTVRTREGREVTSTTSFIAAPDLNAPAGSRITLPTGRVTTVVHVATNTAPGLPVPQHREVSCE